MDAAHFVLVRNAYFKEFLKLKIQLNVANHAAERATEGDRGEQVKNEHLIDFFQILLDQVQAKSNPILNFTLNQVRNYFIDQHVTLQANVGIKKRTINAPAIIQAQTNGIILLKIKTLMVKEKFKLKEDQRLILL